TTDHELVVELYKPRGRRVELAVEPGTYEIRVERGKTSLSAKTDVADGARVVLEPRQFGPAAVAEATRRRGDEPAPPPRPPLAAAGPTRLEIRVGMWQVANGVSASSGASIVSVAVDNLFGGIGYTRYLREDLAATFSIDGVGVEAVSTVGPK